jgi:hypothetical protein
VAGGTKRRPCIDPLAISEALCAWLVTLSGTRGVITANALCEGGAELSGGGRHEDAGPEELSDRLLADTRAPASC